MANHLAFLSVLLCGSFISCNSTPSLRRFDKKPPPIESIAKHTMTKDVFGFDDMVYFENPMGEIEGMRDSFEGRNSNAILAGGPSFIPLERASKFPLAALRITESREAHAHPFKLFAIATSMNASAEVLQADMFVEQKFSKEKRAPIGSLPPPGKYSDGGAVDLFSRKTVPMSVGDYYNTVIILNMKSNRVHTVIGSSAENKTPERVESALESQSFNSSGHPLSGRNLKANRSGKESNSPHIPQGWGIALAFGSYVTDDSDKFKTFLFVSYSLPWREGALIDTESGKETAAKSVFFNILATGTKIPNPLIWRAEAPLESGSGSDGSRLMGHFSDDLEQLEGLQRDQTYYFYAFSGAEMSEAASLDEKAPD